MFYTNLIEYWPCLKYIATKDLKTAVSSLVQAFQNIFGLQGIAKP